MAIQNISIKNFTVFKDVNIDFCEGVNVFIGENGTGKTHLLKILYLASFYNSSNPKYLHTLSSLFGRFFNVKDCELFNTVAGEAEQIPLSMSFAFKVNEKTNEVIENKFRHTNPSLIVVDTEVIKTPTFIPAKEVLSMANLTRVSDDYKSTLDIDVTLTEIIRKAKNLVPDRPSELAVKLADKIAHEIKGTVEFDEKTQAFWINKYDGSRISFGSEAEGYKKLGLLWQLIMNKNITEDTVLLWDEPEANLNPKLIPVIVDMLMELSKHGVQIFIATHDYFFARYLEVRKSSEDKVIYHALYKSDEFDGVMCESQEKFAALDNNSIITQSINLYKEEVKKVMG